MSAAAKDGGLIPSQPSGRISLDNINYKMMGFQAVAASTAGLVGTPLMNVSNKTTLPGVNLMEVIKLARKDPFLGAPWSMVRQFISSIRGTVGIAVLSSSAANNNGRVDMGQYFGAVLAGGLAETMLAGVLIEIPETRVQSGFSRFSVQAVKSFPFVLLRNFMTTVSPTYIIMRRINAEAESAASWDRLGDGGEKHLKNIPLQNTPREWGVAIGSTLAMSTTVAILAAPIQGVAARVMQEQSISDAIKNTKGDFLWVNRKMTVARVVTRALYTGITGSAITIAYLTVKNFLE